MEYLCQTTSHPVNVQLICGFLQNRTNSLTDSHRVPGSHAAHLRPRACHVRPRRWLLRPAKNARGRPQREPQVINWQLLLVLANYPCYQKWQDNGIKLFDLWLAQLHYYPGLGSGDISKIGILRIGIWSGNAPCFHYDYVKLNRSPNRLFAYNWSRPVLLLRIGPNRVYVNNLLVLGHPV